MSIDFHMNVKFTGCPKSLDQIESLLRNAKNNSQTVNKDEIDEDGWFRFSEIFVQQPPCAEIDWFFSSWGSLQGGSFLKDQIERTDNHLAVSSINDRNQWPLVTFHHLADTFKVTIDVANTSNNGEEAVFSFVPAEESISVSSALSIEAIAQTFLIDLC